MIMLKLRMDKRKQSAYTGLGIIENGQLKQIKVFGEIKGFCLTILF
jgi:hypothetical protein